MAAPTEHRVAHHLGLAAREYDAEIRRYLPPYDTMIDTVVGIVGALAAAEPFVVDLGAGTGALGGAILDRVARARVQFLDIDPAMLEVAGTRVAGHGARAELRRGSFDDALPACDAVVASLSLHHVPALDHKRALYERIHAALRPGGVLLVADVTVFEAGAARDHTYGAWRDAMATRGIDRPTAEALFAQWAGEDRYYPLAVELEQLKAAGFTQPECFYKLGPATVFGGFR
ncbi:MAG TPA: class I SAM-dependent methyltransferase [Kofleriaceae bacterium]|nr:class I SAM-dependent methyltransferase [Kofleriaceae bacterium]